MMRAMSFSPYFSVVLIVGAVLLGWGVGWALCYVIHHLPLKLEAAWRSQFAEIAAVTADPTNETPADVHLGLRRWVPWLTAGIFALCAQRYGLSWMTLAALLFCSALITLAAIDAETTLLPDCITLPLMWLGLLVNSGNAWTPLASAVWGAALGYSVLWLVFHAFKRVTGRDGMGFGDFKLMAALGAWLGVLSVPWMLLIAALLGVVGGLSLRALGRAAPGQALPFGPYLALVGIVAILWPEWFAV